MPKSIRPMSRYAQHAVELLGMLIRQERQQKKMTQRELAERLGISKGTLIRIEKGHPGVEIGSVMEAASIVGIPLFGLDDEALRQERRRQADRLTLLPDRIRHSSPEIDDDF